MTAVYHFWDTRTVVCNIPPKVRKKKELMAALCYNCPVPESSLSQTVANTTSFSKL